MHLSCAILARWLAIDPAAEPLLQIVRPLSSSSSRRVKYHELLGKPMADDDLKSELEQLRAENERLKNRQTRGVSLKVSEKGGVSVYGLGRFPVTLYKEQWRRLLDMADDIRAFIKENEAKLKTKSE
jgi:hypothetical protein